MELRLTYLDESLVLTSDATSGLAILSQPRALAQVLSIGGGYRDQRNPHVFVVAL